MGAWVRRLWASLEDGQVVDGVHSTLEKYVPVDKFQRVGDASWNWLDGKSLLE